MNEATKNEKHDAKKPSNAKVLFQNYQAKDDAVQAARKALESAMGERSAAVLAIQSSLGAGPFEWAGKVVKVAKRDMKDDEEKVTGTTYFFRGIGDSVQKID